MSGIGKKIEISANIAIIVVAIMIGVVLVQKYFLAPQTQPLPRVTIGAKVSLPDVDWAKNGRTLVLALQEGCRYCAESAPFYQRLAQEAAKHNVPLVAALPQPVANGQKYLKYIEVPISEIRQSSLKTIQVQAVPTLMLLNNKGEITAAWAGKLPSDKESEVLNSLR